MITISRKQNQITIEGHANYAPMGQDIVCASVSALFITLMNSIAILTDSEAKLDGDSNTRILNIKGIDDSTKLLVDSFFIGIRGISEEYPDYVEIK